MKNVRTTRRDLLRKAANGTVAGAMLGSLFEVRDVFSQDIENAPFLRNGQVDFAELRNQFSLDPKVGYLNHAAIGAIPIAIQKARGKYLSICESNPWLYMWGGEWDEPRETVRADAADLLGCEANEIAITHNTTEMFNTLANGLPLGKGDEVLFSSLNHAGASIAFEFSAETRGYSVRKFDFPTLDANQLTAEKIVEVYAAQIKPATRLIVFPHIDNTIGLRHPVGALAKMARESGVEFVAVDGAQAVGTIDVNLKELNVDMYATSPHKWLGAPKGLGLAFVSKQIQDILRPMWVTWGQERWAGSVRRFEDYGTRNMAEVLALGDAIDFYRKIDTPVRAQQLEKLWKLVKDRANDSKRVRFASPDRFIDGSPVTSVELLQADCNQVASQLFANHQLVVRPFKSADRNAIRVSPNVYTDENDIERLFDVLNS